MVGIRALGLGLVLGLAACGGGDGPEPPGPPVLLEFTNFQAAAVVIGQADFASTMAYGGGTTNAAGLAFPAGSVAEGSLYVSDQTGNRVLGFNAIPSANGAAGDFVMGQTDFTGNASGTTENRFSSPASVRATGSRLLLADFNNDRVLVWNTLPTGNAAADVVIGQMDFVSNGGTTTRTGLDGPLTAWVDGEKLFVADSGNNRVLIWNSVPVANGAPADTVLGQVDFTTGTSGVGASKLDRPRGGWAGGGRLVVADANNSRVLIWNTIPTTHGAAADVVVGQLDFTSNAPGGGPAGLGLPASVAVRGDQLFVADAGNHRVLIYDQIPTANGAVADRVLGQSDFAMTASNDDDQDGNPDATASGRTFFVPDGVAVIGTQLFVTDLGNNRILVFDAP